MYKPVIFLAFANNQGAYLINLNRERKEIKEKLSDLNNAGKIILEHKSATNIEDIFNIFDKYRGQIKIFHYGGHASGSYLDLEGQRADGRALADLFAEETKLNGIELVFLNGCATQYQVAKLLDIGIKAVIATSVKIDDEQATTFAIQFYQSLANDAGIGEAYKKAAALINATASAESRFEQLGKVRFLGALNQEAVEREALAFPWALYSQEGKVENLKWKLSDELIAILDSFKKELLVLVDDSQFNEVFTKIKASNYKYDKFLCSNLQRQISFEVKLNLIDSLKTFIGTLKEK